MATKWVDPGSVRMRVSDEAGQRYPGGGLEEEREEVGALIGTCVHLFREPMG